MPLRPCSGALATALSTSVNLYQADLLTVLLVPIGSGLRMTSWDSNLTVAGNLYTSINGAGAPAFQRGRWNVANTMEVPKLEIVILDNTHVFTANVQAGYFDGASVLLQRVYMPSPGDVTTLGTIDIFSGDVGQATVLGARITLHVRGKNGRLDAKAPRNVYQPGCAHTFCDAGCTLNAATFTTSLTVGLAPTRTVIPTFAAPATMKGGVLTMTSGALSGQKRSIVDVINPGLGSSAVVLAYPLPSIPASGDGISLFQGCDKTLATCIGTYNNKVNFRGFPYIPPPDTNAPNQ